MIIKKSQDDVGFFKLFRIYCEILKHFNHERVLPGFRKI